MRRVLSNVIAINLFFFTILLVFQPQFTLLGAAKEVEISSSKAECVMELNSRRILYENHGELRLPMASTTKIATAITALTLCENVINRQTTIPDIAEGVEGSSVYLKSGDVYTIEDLLYGLMLRSGNDCAVALALSFTDNIAEFCAKMNETAKKAGALDSNFRNPHGLPCENHYATARDLSLIACYALENPIFRQIVATQYYQPRHWKNKNKMLFNYTGAIGVKTGYTKESGRCLVTAAEQNGMTLVCSVLNSPMMYERSAQLLDDAFRAYTYTKLASKEDIFILPNGKQAIKACIKEDVYYPLMQGEEEGIEIRVLPLKYTAKGEIVGQIQISLAKRLLFSGNLYKL